MRIYSHPACLEHIPGNGHPENPIRLQCVLDALHQAFPEHLWRQAPRALREDLLRVHDEALVERIFSADQNDACHWLDADTACMAATPEAVLRAAGAGIGAVEWVLEGTANRAFCAVRPPGHHADAAHAAGFCLVNNIAIAAAHALSNKLVRRLAIVDFDAHHGDGTEAIFRLDPRILYVSSHQQGLYPFTGESPDTDPPHILNRTLPAESDSAAFRQLWQNELLPHIETFAPDLLLISAGFDAHRADPMASLQLQSEDFAWLTERLVAIADHYAQGRVVSMLEGGYALEALAESTLAHVRALAT
ncbi:acetoin utilization protein [Lysobacteraceae bacterium NML07-0707]|nr:acetoin utilization protein [Xanthomonadaceae bacterium NML07-0707]